MSHITNIAVTAAGILFMLSACFTAPGTLAQVLFGLGGLIFAIGLMTCAESKP